MARLISVMACVLGLAGASQANGSGLRADGSGTDEASADRPVRRGQIDRIEHKLSEMVLVPAGTFTMGPSLDEIADLNNVCLDTHDHEDNWACDEEQSNAKALGGTSLLVARDVYLDGFEIDRYEVTADRFRACAAVGACDIAALLTGDPDNLAGELPMVYVTWQDAVDYCHYAGKRLPTEAEWEKAARGTDGRRWPWGNQPRADGANLGQNQSYALRATQNRGLLGQGYYALLPPIPDGRDGALYAVAPGRMRWSQGPYGSFDMAGNVSEWVADYFDPVGYQDLPAVNPARVVPATGISDRVVRGGSWDDWQYRGRTYFRWHGQPEVRSASRGFRCVRDLPI